MTGKPRVFWVIERNAAVRAMWYAPVFVYLVIQFQAQALSQPLSKLAARPTIEQLRALFPNLKCVAGTKAGTLDRCYDIVPEFPPGAKSSYVRINFETIGLVRKTSEVKSLLFRFAPTASACFLLAVKDTGVWGNPTQSSIETFELQSQCEKVQKAKCQNSKVAVKKTEESCSATWESSQFVASFSPSQGLTKAAQLKIDYRHAPRNLQQKKAP